MLERILPLAEEIQALVTLKEANGGTLPYGELARAAERLAPYKYDLLRLRTSRSDLGNTEETDEDSADRVSDEAFTPMHKNGVSFMMNHFLAYHTAYQDRDPAEAFSPFHTKGRPRGRTLPTDVTDFIKGLWKKRGFLSRNHDGTAAEVDYILFAREIRSIAKQAYPEYADIITRADVYHAYEDLEKDDPVGLAYARQGLSALRSALPFQNSNIEGVHEQWQSDIQPLPIYVRWGDIICTVRTLYIIDQKSKVILGWKLIPGKDENLKKDVVKRDFTGQEFRILYVQTMQYWNVRCRQLYADHGVQYRAEAAMSSADRDMISARFEDEVLVYVNLTGDGIRYEPFVRKGAPRLSAAAQKKASRAREKAVITAHRTANDAMDALIRERLGQPLLLDGSRKRHAPPTVQEATPVDDRDVLPKGHAVADWARPGDRQEQNPADAHSEDDQLSANTHPSAPTAEDDDWSFFTGFTSR